MKNFPPRLIFILSLTLLMTNLAGCHGKSADEVVVYCGVDEPAASEVFAEFERQTGIHVAPRYDIESSRTIGLAGTLEAEKDYPHADVWWGSDAFLTVRLANADVLQPYRSAAASDIPAAQFKDANGLWAGVALRARVLVVGEPAPFKITGLQDLLDPRLKNKIAMSRPSAGATGAHMAALYAVWGPEKAAAYFRALHANGVQLLGGNAEVANQVGDGVYVLGLTDSDAVATTIANGGKVSMVTPDQNGMGTLAMPTTVALVKGSRHAEKAKRLIDFILSRQNEQHMIDMKYARWSVRNDGKDTIKAMNLDYQAAARMLPLALRETTEILEGRQP